MSDLFGGQDPRMASIELVVAPDPVEGLWRVTMTVHESTSRRRHTKTVERIPAEILADVLDATAWWLHLATLATLGQHKAIPAKWERRTTGRVVGWSRRER